MVWLTASMAWSGTILAQEGTKTTQWWEYAWGMFWMALNIGTFIFVWAIKGLVAKMRGQLMANSDRLTRLEERKPIV